MTEAHLSTEAMRRLLREDLSTLELAASDAHLRLCPDCRSKMDELTAVPPPVAAFLPSQRAALPSAPPGLERLETIAVGNTATVYRAWQPCLNRVVALKVLVGGWSSEEEAQRRFQTEIEAAATQNHPHVVQLFEVGIHEGRPFFVMEYCAGGSLAQRLKKGPLPEREAAETLEVLARALDSVHSAGFIHRDLKPGNILFDLRRCPKIADFGVVKKQHAAQDATPVGSVLGTPPYLAPEQIDGSRPTDSRCDLYALGIILYECLVGRAPFPVEFTFESLFDLLTCEPPPPRLLNPRLSRDLETICLKCLEKEPGRRYQSALDLAEDLHRFLNHRPVRARRVGIFGRTRRWSRRNPLSAVLTALLLLTLSVGLAICGNLWYGAVESREETEAARREAEEHFLRSRRLLPELVATANSPWQSTVEQRQVRHAALQQAAGFYRELYRARPSEIELVEELAQVLTALAQVARLSGQWEDARRYAEEAVQLWANRAEQDRNSLRYRQAFADSLMQWALAENRFGRADKMEEAYRRAIALYQSLTEDDPTNETYLLMAAAARVRLSVAVLGKVRIDDSITLLNENRQSLENRLNQASDSPSVRLALVETLFRLGQRLELRNNKRAALQCRRDGRKIGEGLNDCFPNNSRAWYFPAACGRLLPPDEPDALSSASALPDLERAARLMESRFVLNLDAESEWELLEEVNRDLADCYVDCGRPQEALRLEHRNVEFLGQYRSEMVFPELLHIERLARLALREKDAGEKTASRGHARQVVDEMEAYCRTHALDAGRLESALDRANSLAPILRHAGATDQSRRLMESMRKVVERREEANPNRDNARWLSEIWAQLAKCCLRDDREGAEAALVQSVSAARRFAAVGGGHHSLLDHRLRRLAHFYGGMDKHAQALACYRECESLCSHRAEGLRGLAQNLRELAEETTRKNKATTAAERAEIQKYLAEALRLEQSADFETKRK
jgi:tetratricopeptide (TPR) repeat protein